MLQPKIGDIVDVKVKCFCMYVCKFYNCKVIAHDRVKDDWTVICKSKSDHFKPFDGEFCGKPMDLDNTDMIDNIDSYYEKPSMQIDSDDILRIH